MADFDDKRGLIRPDPGQQTFGLEVEGPLREALESFVREVSGGFLSRDPSRNWHGLNKVKALHADPGLLDEEARSKLLLISCDDRTDPAGNTLGIDMISLSPQSLFGVDLRNEALGTSAQADSLTQDIFDELPVFQFTAELPDMVKKKEAIIFVGDPSQGINAAVKFVAFLNNDFCRFLMDQKYIFFAIGSWGESSPFQYDFIATSVNEKDAYPFGQDFWSDQ